MMFPKDSKNYPVKNEFIYLAHCGIAPMYAAAVDKAAALMMEHSRKGGNGLSAYASSVTELHEAAASLMQVGADDITFLRNTAEGLSLVANGYPFQPGDEIITYSHEYPSNHYPWLLQKKRGVVVKLIEDSGEEKDRPCAWTLESLEKLCTNRTRMVAVSHVQFTSGFAADLEKLGAFCKERNLDLVIDAAQSLGSIPVFPEKWNVAAVAASGWKWLLGPVGTGLLYTSKNLRGRLEITMAGADLMKQGQDYLNHAWQPYEDGRKFEYSTSPFYQAAALALCIHDHQNKFGIENVQKEIRRLQDIFLGAIDKTQFRPPQFPESRRSGILSLVSKNPGEVALRARSEKVFVTERGGYLRIAPHFYTSDDEMVKAAEILNGVVKTL